MHACRPVKSGPNRVIRFLSQRTRARHRAIPAITESIRMRFLFEMHRSAPIEGSKERLYIGREVVLREGAASDAWGV
jgi:hypothetical protein